jgi:hypothetical protein
MRAKLCFFALAALLALALPASPQLAHESTHLPLGHADLRGGLLLRDQFLLGLFQSHQPVSFGLAHQ